jgi:hypothetical protein
MAFYSGAAVGAYDLLNIIKTQAIANGWVLKRSTTTELILYSSGMGGEDNIYIGFQLFTNGDGVNMRLSSFTGYANTGTFAEQPNYTANVFIYLHNGNEPYWLNITKKRILGAVKIYEPLDDYQKNPVYQIFHNGWLDAYGAPQHLPAPYALVGGGNTSTARWSSVNTDLPARPIVFTPFPRWVKGMSLIQDFTNTMPYTADPEGNLFAMPVSIHTNYTNTTDPYSVATNVTEQCLIGEYDGLIKVLATGGIKSEDTVTINSIDHIVIQNGLKTEFQEYFAIRKA